MLRSRVRSWPLVLLAAVLACPSGLLAQFNEPPAPAAYALQGVTVGPEVTELIQGFVIAMNLETTEEELMHAVFPHPTLSEAMHESVLDAYGRVIHM